METKANGVAEHIYSPCWRLRRHQVLVSCFKQWADRASRRFSLEARFSKASCGEPAAHCHLEWKPHSSSSLMLLIWTKSNIYLTFTEPFKVTTVVQNQTVTANKHFSFILVSWRITVVFCTIVRTVTKVHSHTAGSSMEKRNETATSSDNELLDNSAI